MNRMLPMVILVVGLGIAASSGARNGDSLVEYRRALWTAENGEGADKAAAQAILDAGVPTPNTRMTEWFGAGGLGWGFGVVLIVIGAVMARRQQAAEFSGAGEDSATAVADFPGTVATLAEEVGRFKSALADLPNDATAPEIRASLDRVRVELIEPLVDARGQLIARHGIGVFAEYFGPFSSAERQLNRAWSALTDGHVPTARAAVDDAAESLSQARQAWEQAG
jgi:hypothetical protein